MGEYKFFKRTEYKNIYVADFETTTYPGIKETEVWMSIICPLYSRECIVHDNIDDTLEMLKLIYGNSKVYYHNLKFDGSFLLNKLIKMGCKVALDKDGKTWLDDDDMVNNSFKCMISGMGQFYTIHWKVNNHIICFQDSLKILPFTVERVGKAFCKTFQKGEPIDYTKYRRARGPMTEDEIKYGKLDVLTMVEALEIVFSEGHNNMTIGSCCLAEYKKLIGKKDYEILFPDLTEDACAIPGFDHTDDYVRRSYHGGWCYCLQPGKLFSYKFTDKSQDWVSMSKEELDKHKRTRSCGFTYDVNSLYPSMMHSMSGNKFPVGTPIYWSGSKIPETALQDDKYYFVRIKCKFKLRKNFLPTIQIKNSPNYNSREYLKTSVSTKYNTLFKKTNVIDEQVELTLTMTDFELIKKHYILTELEILDGCYFNAEIGIFDVYIDKYAEIKMNSEGAEREFAKLFLNNLYGKLASSTDSDYKIPYINDKGALSYRTITANDKKAGYIACGSAITSYARNFTISAAQKNYKEFIYADTDSIHTTRAPKNMVDMNFHSSKFCHWAIESAWDEAIFSGPKTYIEHVTHEWDKKSCQLENVKKSFYDIKCAGMGKGAKDNLNRVLSGNLYNPLDEKDKLILKVRYKKLNDDIKKEIQYRHDLVDFLSKPLTMEDFKPGIKVPGNLAPKQIPGGTLLIEKHFEMHSK